MPGIEADTPTDLKVEELAGQVESGRLDWNWSAHVHVFEAIVL
jgi:hypothetical protein